MKGVHSSAPHRVTHAGRVRGTQSLLQIQAQCWRRPGLIARELAWRWLFGIPALLLLFALGRTAAGDSLCGPYGSRRLLAATTCDGGADCPFVLRCDSSSALGLARWAVPLLLAGWAVASGVGRAFVLRALVPGRDLRPVSLVLLQLLRVIALVLSWYVWFAMVRWAAARDVTHVPQGTEPNMVAFAAWLICLSLGSFIVWALWSWVLSIAGVLMVAEDRSLISALTASVQLGPLTMQLVEVNLVLGIVKLALIVLAMVFSAIPLPFEAQMSGDALYLWWVAVGIWYLAASDFFQVARSGGVYRVPAESTRTSE